jgi:hypothetical protein
MSVFVMGEFEKKNNLNFGVHSLNRKDKVIPRIEARVKIGESKSNEAEEPRKAGFAVTKISR